MSLLDRRLLGFRAIDVLLFLVLVGLILGVYLAKTLAGRERGQIATVERKIAQERDRIVLLEAEVAHLERPERLAAMARAYGGLAPAASGHEIPPERLAEALQSPLPSVPAAAAAAAVAVQPLPAETETSSVAEDEPAAAPALTPAAAPAPEPKP
ncbi:cell division protein [Phenylobacterium sp.]|uniref:cell division protein FtsL n=1 Tax=Phenylobacterium sp. TaxID=1871053 RepID=UPI0037CC2E98